jgi:hypothetical protein
MTKPDDNIKWFYQHCSSNCHFLVPMLGIALFTIKRFKKLIISHVSNKVKSDFFKIQSDYSKVKGNLVLFYIEPITACRLYLIDDKEFNVDNCMTFYLSISIDVPKQPSPLTNVLEQGTPLTNNLSERAKQDCSRQLQKSNVQHSENTAKQQSLDEQGLHAESASAASTSSKIAPVNLEMNFAAEKLEENKVRSDSPDCPSASNKGIDNTPHKNCMGKVSVKNKFCKKYCIADAWINGNIVKYQQKLSGRRSTDFKFLYPVLICSICAFQHNNVAIPIGEIAYTNTCANTDVWLDGDFISTFASLVCHNNHSLVQTAPMKSGQDVPQFTHVPYPKFNDYKALPSSVKWVVAVMHTNQHYVVIEITIDTKTIKIFDRLY